MKKAILTIDPGKDNFAYSLTTKSNKLINYGILKNTIININENIFDNIILFKNETNEIKKICEYYEYIIVFERFMPRFQTKGNTNEITNISIGIFLSSFFPKKAFPITASAWKRKMKTLNITYKSFPGLSKHILDTLMMHIYFSLKKDYLKDINKFIKNCNRTIERRENKRNEKEG